MKLRELDYVLQPFQKVKLFYDRGTDYDTVVIEKEWWQVAGVLNSEVISIWSSKDDTIGIRAKEID